MNLTNEQMRDFEMLVTPLIKWLNDNCHPHVTVIVDSTNAELMEGVFNIRTEVWRD